MTLASKCVFVSAVCACIIATGCANQSSDLRGKAKKGISWDHSLQSPMIQLVHDGKLRYKKISQDAPSSALLAVGVVEDDIIHEVLQQEHALSLSSPSGELEYMYAVVMTDQMINMGWATRGKKHRYTQVALYEAIPGPGVEKKNNYVFGRQLSNVLIIAR